MTNIGLYIMASVAIITAGVVVVFVPAEEAKAWAPLLGGLIVAAPSLYSNFQNRAAAKQIENVHEAVNSGSEEALRVKGESERAKGISETIELLKPAIADAVAAERARGEVTAERVAEVTATNLATALAPAPDTPTTALRPERGTP